MSRKAGEMWNRSRGRFEQPSAEVAAFMSDLFALYEKHGLSIGHEDTHGGFIIENDSEHNREPLRAGDAMLESKKVGATVLSFTASTERFVESLNDARDAVGSFGRLLREEAELDRQSALYGSCEFENLTASQFVVDEFDTILESEVAALDDTQLE